MGEGRGQGHPFAATEGQQTTQSRVGGPEQTLTQPSGGAHSAETVWDFWPPGLPDRRFLLFKAQWVVLCDGSLGNQDASQYFPATSFGI